MNFAADPHWGWWIVGYFYLGGIAAGAFTTAVILDWVGGAAARPLARIGYRLAFPLIGICGVLLIVDLDRPERFWHMLVKSEVVHEAMDAGEWSLLWRAPSFKWWSPMSIGSWALSVFGFCSGLAFLGSFLTEVRMGRLLHSSLFARAVQVIGILVGYFVAAYTGALITATNQPLWSDSTWIAPLFLTSAASTGLAAITLLGHRHLKMVELREKLRRAEVILICLETVFYLGFVVTLFLAVGMPLFHGWHGLLLVGALPLFGMMLPLVLHVSHRLVGPWGLPTAAVLVLIGGLMLRIGVLVAAAELRGEVASAATTSSTVPLPGFSPEEGRQRGGGPGADPGNHPSALEPRNKWSGKE